MFKNSSLFGTSFSLVKTAPKVRGGVIDCAECYVLFLVARSVKKNSLSTINPLNLK